VISKKEHRPLSDKRAMPPDLTVPAIAGQQAAQIAPTQPARGETEAAPTASGPQFPNPSLRLDHGLGLVVIEFHDHGGEVTRSIPSQRQIDAYRSHQTDTLPGARAPDPQPKPAETAPVPAIPAPSKPAPQDTDIVPA